VNQLLELLDEGWVTGGDLGVVHLVAEVALGKQSGHALIDLVNEHGVKVHAEFLSLVLLVVEGLDALSNRLVHVIVLHAPDEVADIELLLESQMKLLCLVFELDIYVDVVGKHLLEDFVNSLEIASVHSSFQVALCFNDSIMAVMAAANSLLLVFTFDGVVDPVDPAAFLTVETALIMVAFVTLSAEKLGVLEREQSVTALRATTFLLLLTLRNQVLKLGVRCQVLRSVAAVICYFEINTLRHEELHHFGLRSSSCLMHRIVSMDVN
jgi:hypothetical protein